MENMSGDKHINFQEGRLEGDARAMRAMALAIAPMLAIYLVKKYSVYYYSSRGIALGYPFDSLTFAPGDRYTDWLIPAAVAALPNPYDIPPSFGLPLTPPYGYLTFLVLKTANVFGTHLAFVLCILTFLMLCYLIFNRYLIRDHLTCLTYFLAMIAGFYPLYMEVDRGNVAIFTAVALAAIFLLIRSPSRSRRVLVIILLATIVCFKPSNALYMLPVFVFGSLNESLIVLSITGINYIIPIFLPRGSLRYLFAAIGNATRALGPQQVFCNNLACGFRALGLPSMPITIAAIVVFTTLSILIIARLRCNRLECLPLSISIVTVASLLVADPSGDYSLILLLPIFLYMIGQSIAAVDERSLLRLRGFQLILGFVLASAFVNIYFQNEIHWYTVSRTSGLIIMFIVASFWIISRESNTKIE